MPSNYAQKKRWSIKHRDLHLASKSRNNKRRGERNKEWLKNYKATLSCACGEHDPVCLDFHHTNPDEKSNGVAYFIKASLTRLKEEIAKCIPICAHCHRKGHAGRPRPEHEIYFPKIA
jgi:hypothetical protein